MGPIFIFILKNYKLHPKNTNLGKNKQNLPASLSLVFVILKIQILSMALAHITVCTLQSISCMKMKLTHCFEYVNTIEKPRIHVRVCKHKVKGAGSRNVNKLLSK